MNWLFYYFFSFSSAYEVGENVDVQLLSKPAYILHGKWVGLPDANEEELQMAADHMSLISQVPEGDGIELRERMMEMSDGRIR